MKSIVPLIWFLASAISSVKPSFQRHSIVSNPELFTSVLKGNQHVVIALGNQAGDRIYASEGHGQPEVKLQKPEKQNEPDPNEVWFLEPCAYCPPNIYRIKHLQTDKYLAISTELYEKYYHTLTLFECKKNYTQGESSLMPYTLDDLKIYWEISPTGSFIRNVYYNEYLIPEKSTRPNNPNDNAKGPEDGGDKSQKRDSQNLYTGSKLDRDSYWITFPKAALLYTPPPTPINPNPGVQPQLPYPGAQPQPNYPGTQPQLPYPGAQPYPQYPGAQPYPQYPGAQPHPQYPGAQPHPQYPGAQPQLPYPAVQPRPPYPGAQPHLPYPGNQPRPQIHLQQQLQNKN